MPSTLHGSYTRPTQPNFHVNRWAAGPSELIDRGLRLGPPVTLPARRSKDRDPNTVDSGTGSDHKFSDAKRHAFSTAGCGGNRGFWHTRLARGRNLWSVLQRPNFLFACHPSNKSRAEAEFPRVTRGVVAIQQLIPDAVVATGIVMAVCTELDSTRNGPTGSPELCEKTTRGPGGRRQ